MEKRLIVHLLAPVFAFSGWIIFEFAGYKARGSFWNDFNSDLGAVGLAIALILGLLGYLAARSFSKSALQFLANPTTVTTVVFTFTISHYTALLCSHCGTTALFDYYDVAFWVSGVLFLVAVSVGGIASISLVRRSRNRKASGR